ncbi:endonuclease/exonuclease/phosphatase family protein [Allostreptomyces psammosilenae]|uniref:Endonuclease/exonuclease/phosphatase family metal-dependent hydrolase n=1 Tax=Allostreptomyces psammosilenae TaxID=1892865 RepID=A0A853A2D5_9ACTN|nr:endonuclease/exonuclease/phosphatase family protein [Allostreptomyces psammosilenae]NYI07044.1 endonuclease/exonuclease/phosphatase family metal-dependent hydrolase [Allostreptomyces psammosilenae]
MSGQDRTRADGGAAAPTGAVPLRLMTYNVRSMRDDVAAIGRVVRACRPDLLCVQEAPRFWGAGLKAARLARACGLVTVAGGKAAAGPLLLASLRVRIRDTRTLLLPRTPGLHQRGLAMARVEVAGAPAVVASCHLSLDAAERAAQADRIRAELEAFAGGAPVLLAGDVNEPPGGAAWRRLLERYRDARAEAPRGGEHTFPSAAPVRRIDAVFVSPGVTVAGCGVPVGGFGAATGDGGVTDADLAAATDHRPVLAELLLGD